ncbi:MAG: patatin-like phospholipase family protein [Kiritimatiellae bacterium]|nr:patatin-like phospholipase family protein [Kiritimatiellia bacterium]
MEQFRNLVFEGGGVRGIAYAGALRVLAGRGLLDGVRRAGGTSAGAISALLFVLGYTPDEQQEIYRSTAFAKFMDDSFGFLRDFRRLWREFGWHKGDFFTEWAGALVGAKLGNPRATFGDLRSAGQPDLYVTGTNLSTGYTETFSAERQAEMPLAEALRISMSIPLFFRAVRHGPRDDVYVDGGVLANYPVKLFDRQSYIDMELEPGAARRSDYYERENARFLRKRPESAPYVYNRQTLGLRLDSAEEIGLFRYGEPVRGRPIKTFPAFALALTAGMMQVQENQHLHSDDWQRTLYINTLDVGTTDFNISVETKDALVREGERGAENYLKWFGDPGEDPVNRLPG